MQRGTQAMMAPVGLILFLLVVGGRCEDAVVANVGRHTMSRIAKLLSPSECHQLQEWLVGPNNELEEQELEQLSEENNSNRHHQDLRGPMGCLEGLHSWLRTAGETVTWDWLVHGLRQIGRPDIARELGKNLNQDRSLELRRSLEEYSRSVQHFTHSLLMEGKQRSQARRRRAPDLGDLFFERQLPPPYTRSLLGWVSPLVLGILGGFLTSFLFAMVTLYFSCGMLGI